MSEWPIKSIGELAAFHRGITWASSQETEKPEPGCVPVLRIPNVQERLNTTSILFLRGISAEKRRQFAATKTWLLMVGSNGNPNRVGDCVRITQDTDYLFASFLVGVEPKSDEDVDPCFLHYLLRSDSVRKAVSDSIKGTTGLRNISISHLAAHEVRCPPPAEQRKIARILTTLDNLIEKTETLIAKYQAIKQGMMHDLFTRGVDAQGHLRPPQAEAPDLYKQSELGWIPKEWEETTVGNELIGIDAGKSPDCPDTPAPRGEWGVLKVSAVQPDGFLSHENKIITNHTWANPVYEVHDGDLLISRSNTYQLVGLVCLVRSPQPRLMLCDKTLRLRFDPRRAMADFMFWLLQEPHARRQIEIHATGTSGSMKNISQPVVRSLRLALPPVTEQERINCRIQAIQKKMKAEQLTVEKMRHEKIGLMQDLLTGKVRVNADETEEVAAYV